MSKLHEYSKVKICKLIQNPDKYDGWQVNQRMPAVGDVGTLIDILHAEGLPEKYVVEKTDANGVPIWLSDFFEEELEPE
jgi:hypothetical protein